MAPIRVLLVDDHTLFRRGVAALLAAEPDFELVGEAEHGAEAIEMARELSPDAILMDVSARSRSGADALRWMQEQVPRVPIVLCHLADADRPLFETARSSAQSALSTDVEPQTLFVTLRAVARGEAPARR
jgi:DNA-binding NarL/FixJ family response regulator